MKIPASKRKYEYYPLRGGEDLISPALTVDPGKLRFSKNYECDENGRYRRIDGYERCDGRPRPSDASYWVLNFDTGSAAISVADTVTGAGGASGEALVVEVETGSWVGGDATGYLILFNVTGTYVDGEVLSVGGNPKAIADGVATKRGADNDTDDATWYHAAIVATRADIGEVPGSGNILGVWMYDGVKYAFRNNAAGTAAVMHKSSTSGWTECALGERLGFSTGSAAFVEGEVVSQVAVTATVRRVVVKTGAWGGGSAAGFFVITGRAGGNFAAAAIGGSIAGVANATGVQTANAFSVPSGKFRLVNENFGGTTTTRRMYGCDGKNKAFEWDGTYFTPIETGMVANTPEFIFSHKKHLFLGFEKGSLQHSGIGLPYSWTAVTGATEIGLGDEITGHMKMPGDVMAIFSRNSTHILYGSSSADWDLKTHSRDSGAIEDTVQRLGPGIYSDDRGITFFQAVQEYGDFAANAISAPVKPFLDTVITKVVGSLAVRNKNQYRLFFSDNQVLSLRLEKNKVIGFTRQIYDNLVTCSCSGEDSVGKEILLFGSDDGYVYELDAGTSFDGEEIEAYIHTHYNNLKSPNHYKHFFKTVLECAAPSDANIKVVADFSYGEEPGSALDETITGPGGTWDIDYWEDFVWDSPSVATAQAYTEGMGTNIGYFIYSTGTYESPHTIQGLTVHFELLGMQL